MIRRAAEPAFLALATSVARCVRVGGRSSSQYHERLTHTGWGKPLAPVVAPVSSAQPRRAVGSWTCVETPNPDVCKFEPLVPAGDAIAARGIDEQIRALQGVRDVFLGGISFSRANTDSSSPASNSTLDFIAVTRDRGTNWQDLAPRVQAVLDALPAVGADIEFSGETLAVPVRKEYIGIEATIFDVLENRVRPTVQADGGDVELSGWDADTGKVTLLLRGACRGCPQSAATLQDTILKTLKHFIPEVQTVVAEEEGFDDTEGTASPSADIPWNHIGEPRSDEIAALVASGTPFFSVFAGLRVEGKMLKRVKFMSRLALDGRTPEHVIVKCTDCGKKAALEDPNDLLREDKGNPSGKAAVVICPACCVLITK